MEKYNEDYILFDDVSFSDLIRDIYFTTKEKEKKINELINQLEPMVNNISDATIAVPLIKDYLDIGVKNNEHLIKMAGVLQRAIANKEKNSGGSEMLLLTEDEKVQLMKLAEAEVKPLKRG
jgi:hypothetical protein